MPVKVRILAVLNCLTLLCADFGIKCQDVAMWSQEAHREKYGGAGDSLPTSGLYCDSFCTSRINIPVGYYMDRYVVIYVQAVLRLYVVRFHTHRTGVYNAGAIWWPRIYVQAHNVCALKTKCWLVQSVFMGGSLFLQSKRIELDQVASRNKVH